jgi:hypothetical protein
MLKLVPMSRCHLNYVTQHKQEWIHTSYGAFTLDVKSMLSENLGGIQC